MLPVNDLPQLGQRVAATHGWPAARSFKAYAWTEADQASIAACASDLLKVFPKHEGSTGLLTAALAVELERRLDAPVHLVAGTLSLGGGPVIGDRQPFDGPRLFDQPDPAWSGHLWVMVGPNIVDIAIFRMAYSADCPPELARHVHSVFGQGKALYADRWRKVGRLGLAYEPQYVLSRGDVDRMMTAAYHFMTRAQASR